MSMVICERCDRAIDSDDDPGCFIDNAGWCADEIACESCRERAYDAQQERLMAGDGPPTMQEQYMAAWKQKQELR